ncbi:MAG: 3-deoxy-manno-octulosonate cytidylyltransferase [Paludibacteraceae bacterium]|nr:3-deoxy-manno-octulosonate cytidylyltransferase [Paludibacteraceae bacterium]
MQFIGIIPARYASTRFPGKPLALIGDQPMIERVYRQASKALDKVVVATDDHRIYDTVIQFGGQAVMTREDHKCGTDRCLEAYDKLQKQNPDLRDENTVIINIQGDEPFIQPEQIEAVKSCFPTEIATLVKPYTEEDTWEALANPNTPKVAIHFDEDGKTGQALMFSRSIIPYLRGIDKADWLKAHKHYRHIGLYAYRGDILRQITRLPQGQLERAESLEQLRWLENGYRIKVAVCATQSIGIDTPDDLNRAIEFLHTIEHNKN